MTIEEESEDKISPLQTYMSEPLDDSQRAKHMFLLDEWEVDPKIVLSIQTM